MPCAICGTQGYSVAAHLTSRGAGGKASDIVPLCRARTVYAGNTANSFTWFTGCHGLYDAHEADARKQEGRLRELAAKLWQDWTTKEKGDGLEDALDRLTVASQKLLRAADFPHSKVTQTALASQYRAARKHLTALINQGISNAE